MKPKKQEKKSQFEMFETRLENLCAGNHPLVVLARQINWSSVFDGDSDLFCVDPAPTRGAVRITCG